MFDLLLVLTFFISGVFAGILSRVMLSRGSFILRSSFGKKKAMIIGGVGVGLVGGIGLVILTLVLTIASGESPTGIRLILSFIEGSVPVVAGVLTGFVVTGAKLAN